jgi:rhomboid-like protein
MCYKLVGCFVGIYLLSAIPAVRQLARRTFSHDPLSGRVFSLFTSQFGHAGLLHLGVNSFALIGFGTFSISPFRPSHLTSPR